MRVQYRTLGKEVLIRQGGSATFDCLFRLRARVGESDVVVCAHEVAPEPVPRPKSLVVLLSVGPSLAAPGSHLP